MEYNESLSIVEAILFAAGEPISLERLSESSGLDTDTAAKLVDALERRYSVSQSAITILKLGQSYQMATRDDYAPYIKKAMESKRQARLSPAALEVLAVVAYNQPVTKAFVEQVRGTDSSGVISTLVERELLTEAGRLELPGRPLTYKTTENFLRCFKLKSLADLPKLPGDDDQIELQELADALDNAENPEYFVSPEYDDEPDTEQTAE